MKSAQQVSWVQYVHGVEAVDISWIAAFATFP